MFQRSAADIILSQETKVSDDDSLPSFTLSARAAGWNPIVTKATRTSEHIGSGGTGAFARRGAGVCDATLQLVKPQYRHRICIAWIDAVSKGGVYCLSSWLRHSEGLSADNIGILGELSCVIRQLQGPWICGGDWNIEPHTLEASRIPTMVGGKIFATTFETCNSSAYDFFLVECGIAHAVVAMKRLKNGCVSTHWPSRLLVRGDNRRYFIRKLVPPPKVSGALPNGPAAQPTAYDSVIRLASCSSTFNDVMTLWYQLAGEESSISQVRTFPSGSPGPKGPLLWDKL